MSNEISREDLKFFPENYQKIVVIEENILKQAKIFVDIFKQVQEITLLPKEQHETVLRDLEKQSKVCSEQWMRSLESLDGIQIDDNLSKSKRKSVIDCAKSYMGKNSSKIYDYFSLNTSRVP